MNILYMFAYSAAILEHSVAPINTLSCYDNSDLALAL